MASMLLWFALGFFAFMVVYRIRSIGSMPLHLRWELYPSPLDPKHEYGGSFMEEVDFINKPQRHLIANGIKEMTAEVFLLKKVREHNRYGVWPFSLAMHWGLYLLLLWVLLLAVEKGFGLTAVAPLRYGIDVLAGGLGSVGTLGLIVKRAANRDLATYTSPVDYFNLIFLAGIFGTGLAGWFPVHTILFAAFLVYMPFSKLFHYVAKYFTIDKVLWDDHLNTRGSEIEQKIQTQLGYKVAWSAQHIASGKTWVDQVMVTDAREGKQ